MVGEPQWRNELSSPFVALATWELLTAGWTEAVVVVMEAGVGRELEGSVFFLVTRLPLGTPRDYISNESE